MIITKINGGLGNQMFSYAVGRAVAIKNNDILKLDITEFKKQKIHHGYRLNAFRIDEKIAANDEINFLKTSGNIFIRKLIKAGILRKKKSWYAQKRGFATKFDENIFLHKDIYLDGLWQSEEYFVGIKDVLVKDFALKEQLNESVYKYMNLIKNSDSIAIHVRRGDFIALGWFTDVDYYKKAANFINQQIKNPTFFIFSDDIKWCKENLDFIPNPIFVDNTNSELEDLELMKNAKHNIIPNSTFSWWAAWLNENQEKIIIAPKHWFKNDDNFNPVPTSWVRL